MKFLAKQIVLYAVGCGIVLLGSYLHRRLHISDAFMSGYVTAIFVMQWARIGGQWASKGAN